MPMLKAEKETARKRCCTMGVKHANIYEKDVSFNENDLSYDNTSFFLVSIT